MSACSCVGLRRRQCRRYDIPYELSPSRTVMLVDEEYEPHKAVKIAV
jgi:hypothetical protein